jgi:hypothetical protein
MAEIETPDGDILHVPNSSLIEAAVHVGGNGEERPLDD